MSSITDLVYKITADGSAFAKELQKASREVKDFQEKSEKQLKKFNEAFEGLSLASVERKAKAVFDATRTSAEQYANRLDELAKLQKVGAIDADTYARATAKAKDAYVASLSPAEKLQLKQEELSASYRAGAISQKDFESQSKSLKREIAELGGTKDKTSKALKTLRNALVAAGAGAATLKFGRLIQGSIDAADELGKTSDRLGISTRDLSALGFAAEQSGSSLGAFEKGAKNLSQSLASAAQGSGKAAKLFDDLGISVTETDGSLRGTIDVVRDLADRFSTLENGAEKTALAQELFGKSGAELIPLLNEGSEGLAAFAEQAENLGLIIEDKTARQAAAFNDNLNMLKKTQVGVVNQIGAQVLPTLVQYSNRLAANATDSNKLAKSTEFITTGLKIVLTVVEGVVGVFKGLGETLGALLALIFNFGTQAIKVFQAFGRNIAAVGKALTQALSGDLSGAFETIKGSLGDTLGTIGDGFRSQIAIVSTAYNTIGGIVSETVAGIGDIWTGEAPEVEAAVEKAVEKSFRPIRNEVKAQKEAFDEAGKAAQDYAKLLERDFAAVMGLIKTDADRLAEGLDQIDRLLKAQAISAETAALATDILKEKYDEVTIATRRLAEEGQRLADSLKTPLEQYQASVEQIEALFAAGAISRETYDRAIEASTQRLGDSLKQTGEEVKKLGITLESSAGALFDTLEGALFDPLNASIEDMVVNFARALSKMALEAAKQQAIKALLSGAAGGATGGATLLAASGGYISGPGTGTSDSIPARLSNGEFVMRAAAVKKYGVGFMAALNGLRTPASTSTPRFADGGPVGGGGDMNVTNVNFFDPRELDDYLQSRAGERVIVNVMRRNRNAIA
jgi:hypothetical protein